MTDTLPAERVPPLGSRVLHLVAVEWTDGRYYPGELQPDGSYLNGRAAPVQATAMAKIGVGLLHGVLSSITSSVWCILAGTLFVWLPRILFFRPRNDGST